MRKFAFALALFVLGPSAFAAEARPNVLVILADDQGWGDLSANGNTNLKTPNIDSLAREGARFEHFYVQPVCAPTRAEFLTGRWHSRGGVHGVSTGAERLDLDERTIAEAFQKAGYATACFGKWHNGTQYPYHPNARGFEEYYGFTSGHWGEYFNPPLDHNGQDVKGEGFLADDLTNHAIGFMQKQVKGEKPFFCYLAFNTPHSPMQVPDPYWARFKNAQLKLTGEKKENLDHTRAALAMCENLDDNVGRLLAALGKAKIDGNTIVLYFSDNGPNGARWVGGLKGQKGSTDEGGVRSPLHVRWPGQVKPGTCITPIAGAIDLYPTLIDLTGIARVGEKPFDGVSLAPLLRGKATSAPERMIFNHWAGRTSVRDSSFRLDAAGQLFDLTSDPGQQKNIAAEKPQDAKRLGDALVNWKKDVLGELPKTDDRPFPVGFSQMPRAVLPARDGKPQGSVKRSAGAPNCSFFTNWAKPQDAMTWDIEVNTAGQYEAVVNYTCTKDNVGSTIELALGDAKWTGTIAEAHDPPLRGKEHDRVNRGSESYVKDFRPLSLGVIDLKPGTGTLKLRSSRIAGMQVGDIRSVELILKP